MPSEEETNNINKDDFYEVETILDDKKRRDGKRIFKVKWKDAQDEWVPQTNLSCPNIVQQYFQEKKIRKITQQILSEDLHEQVLAVKYLEPNQELVFSVRLANGKIKEISKDEMKSKHLSTLLNFYESNIVFGSKEVIPEAFNI